MNTTLDATNTSICNVRTLDECITQTNIDPHKNMQLYSKSTNISKTGHTYGMGVFDFLCDPTSIIYNRFVDISESSSR